jgi:hypothetical protein
MVMCIDSRLFKMDRSRIQESVRSASSGLSELERIRSTSAKLKGGRGDQRAQRPLETTTSFTATTACKIVILHDTMTRLIIRRERE